MSRILKTTLERLLGARIGIAAWRHLAAAISRRFLDSERAEIDALGSQGGFPIPQGLEEGESEDDSENDDPSILFGGDAIYDLQSGPTSSTSRLVYGREAHSGPSIAGLPERYRAIS